MAFVNRSPVLLVIDEENVLSYYDLTVSVQTGAAAKGTDLIQLGTDVEQIWGVTIDNKRFAVLKIQDPEETMILWVPLDDDEDPYPIRNAHPETWLDPMTGNLLEPGKNASILERDRFGEEACVYRSLPNNQWLSFNHNGVLDRSKEAI